MTREEARNILKNKSCVDCVDRCTYPLENQEGYCEYADAISMAIEALKADTPDTNDGDTISRAAAIDAVYERIRQIGYENNPSVLSIRQAIRDLPSVQPEPAIPLQWIEAQIEWLKSLDNAFSVLTAGQISAMVNKWKDEQDE